MSWIQGYIDDENVFPCRIGAQFPPNFQSTVKNIFKRLFRVYGHIYHSHFSVIVQLGEEPHLNTSFKRLFLLFNYLLFFKLILLIFILYYQIDRYLFLI